MKPRSSRDDLAARAYFPRRQVGAPLKLEAMVQHIYLRRSISPAVRWGLH